MQFKSLSLTTFVVIILCVQHNFRQNKKSVGLLEQ